jgi:hypothetical protein
MSKKTYTVDVIGTPCGKREQYTVSAKNVGEARATAREEYINNNPDLRRVCSIHVIGWLKKEE